MRDGAAGVGKATSSPGSVREKPCVIAVDGSAASGKSTVGRKLAEKLGYPFLDTGLMYRAVTLAALERGLDIRDGGTLSRLAGSLVLEVAPPTPGSLETCAIRVDGVDVTAQLRRADVEEAVSLVSRVAGVREALVRQQREIAGRQPMVMAGRDIGTVVLPGADLKVYLDASISERARRLHSEHPLDLVIVDYLQLVGGSGPENRVQEISEVSRSLKALARELNVPVLALSQLSRAVESRSPHIPMLSDLRDSGSIEQDSDVVIFIYREDVYDRESDRKGITDLHIAKHRNGPTGVVSLLFQERSTRFVDLGEDPGRRN